MIGVYNKDKWEVFYNLCNPEEKGMPQSCSNQFEMYDPSYIWASWTTYGVPAITVPLGLDFINNKVYCYDSDLNSIAVKDISPYNGNMILLFYHADGGNEHNDRKVIIQDEDLDEDYIKLRKQFLNINILYDCNDENVYSLV